jgi:polysaccharide biosynthesis transport protein
MSIENNERGAAAANDDFKAPAETLVRADSGARAIQEPPIVIGHNGARYTNDVQRWDTLDLQQLLAMLARRWRIIAATMVVVVSIAMAYATLAKPIYQAQTTIEMDNNRSNNSDPGIAVITEMMDGSSTRDTDTQVAILKGLPFKKLLLDEISEAERVQAKQFFETDVATVGDTNLVRIEVRTYSADLSQKLANMISEKYIDMSLAQNRSQVKVARQYVEGQLQRMRDRLNKAQIELADYKKQTKTFSLEEESKALVATTATLAAQREEADANRLSGLAQLKALQSAASKIPEVSQAQVTISRSPQAEALKSKLTQTQIDLIEAQQEFTDNHPRVVALKSQIKEIEGKLSGKVEFETSSKATVANPVRQSLLQSITELQGQIWASEARSKAYARAVEVSNQKLTKLPEHEYRLSSLTTNVSALQQAYNLLNEQYQTLLISEQAKPASARPVFPAEKGKQVAPRRLLILLMALAFGSILAIALAALIDRLDSRVHSDVEAEAATRLPVLAHIPQMDKPGQERLIAGGTGNANFTLVETFQMLRTNITFSALDEPIRSVIVTSTLPSEGKSTCATNLAIAAAQTGERVILVDCDLRRPSVDRQLKLPNKVGFTSVVTGACSLQDALQETAVPGLRVLTSGPTPPNPFHMLNSRAARSLLRQLRNEADFVVIDTPPALGMADAQLIATTADAILLVVSTQGAKKHEIARTRDLLSQTGVEMLGTILNRVKTGFGGYYGYGYSYYQYGAYAKDNANGQSLNGKHDDSVAALPDEEKRA